MNIGNALVGSTIAILSTAVVGVLPGFGVRQVLRRPDTAPSIEVALAIMLSMVAALGASAILIALRWFSPWRVLPLLLLLALFGLQRAIRLARKAHFDAGVLAAALLVIPTALTISGPGYRSARLYRWYYWHIGANLTSAGGIPAFVTEYGLRVRWLPDYVLGNIQSQLYDTISPASAADAMQWWIVPTGLLFLIACYAVMRLWFGRSASLVGVCVAITTFYLSKFNGYKPEALASGIGLLGIWLLVRGLRDSSRELIMAGGVTFALSMCVHPIAAIGVIVLGVVSSAIEVIRTCPARRRAALTSLVIAAAATVVITASVGIALQGRAFAAGDASNPQRTADGTDSTFKFREYQAGRFETSAAPSALDEFRTNVETVWPGKHWTEIAGLIAIALIILGIGCALIFANLAACRGAIVALAYAAALISVIAVFILCFDTFVPQHTGSGRFVDYIPLAIALCAATAAEGWASATTRLFGKRVGRAIGIAAFGITLVIAVYSVFDYANTGSVLTPNSEAALRFLRENAQPGEVVVSNAATRGLIEFATGKVENPLDARQPLIEDPVFLRDATAALLRTHAFLSDPAKNPPPFEPLTWVVIADPGEFGTSTSYGGSINAFSSRAAAIGLQPVWSRPGITIFHRGDTRTVERWGPAANRVGPVALGLGISTVFFLAVWFFYRRQNASATLASDDTTAAEPTAPTPRHRVS